MPITLPHHPGRTQHTAVRPAPSQLRSDVTAERPEPGSQTAESGPTHLHLSLPLPPPPGAYLAHLERYFSPLGGEFDLELGDVLDAIGTSWDLST